MSSPSRVLIMLGSGPGIGVGVASHFASQNFDKIALLSRNAERLNHDAASVLEAVKQSKGTDSNVTVKTYAVDVSDVKILEAVLQQVVAELGKPEVVVYNAARLGGGKFFEANEESVNNDFKVCHTKKHITKKYKLICRTRLQPLVSTPLPAS